MHPRRSLLPAKRTDPFHSAPPPALTLHRPPRPPSPRATLPLFLGAPPRVPYPVARQGSPLPLAARVPRSPFVHHRRAPHPYLPRTQHPPFPAQRRCTSSLRSGLGFADRVVAA